MQRQVQSDILTHQAPQDFLRITYDHIQIHYLGFHDLAPAEGQQLASQVCRALTRICNQLEFIAQGILWLEAEHHELAAAIDYREQVIEVVGYSAGQLSYGLHLLGLAE